MTEQQDHIEKLWDRIERYIGGQMTDSERSAFELQMQSDSELQKEVELHRSVHTDLGIQGALQFRKTLRDVSHGQRSTASAITRDMTGSHLWRILSIAALVVVTVGIFYFINKPDTPDQFAMHFEPYNMILSERAAGDVADDAALLNQAIRDYRAGAFSDASEKFDQLSDRNTGSLTYQFYSAVSALASGNCDKASGIFEQLVALDNHLLVQQSRWYHALSHLRCGSHRDAIDLLNQIQPGDYKYQEAKDLIKQ